MNIIHKDSPAINLLKFAQKKDVVKDFRTVFESKNINQLVKRIYDLASKIDCSDYEIGKTPEECRNKIKGDIFEIFCFYWMCTFGGDRGIFSFGVEWCPRDTPGIDFMSRNKLGHFMPIQSKYFGNSNIPFEADGRLETFYKEVKNYTTINTEGVKLCILFTSADKIAWRYAGDQNMLVIDKKLINKYSSEKNQGFWISFQNRMNKIFE